MINFPEIELKDEKGACINVNSGNVVNPELPQNVCEKNNIEPEDVKKFISPVIRDKVEVEAMDLNLLDIPKKNNLDSAFA